MSENDRVNFFQAFSRFIQMGIRSKSARVVVGKEFNVLHSFTLETSYCGYKDSEGYIHPFYEKDMF